MYWIVEDSGLITSPATELVKEPYDVKLGLESKLNEFEPQTSLRFHGMAHESCYTDVQVYSDFFLLPLCDLKTCAHDNFRNNFWG